MARGGLVDVYDSRRHVLGGIFSGMFSPRDSQAVLDDLGDKFPTGLIHATRAARADWIDFRRERPSWVASFFERESANLIHSRLWYHLERELADVPEITLINREPHREICVQTPMGRTYEIRAKRHGKNDTISSYPTLSDIAFWGAGVDALEGMERVRLAVGYRWDRVTSEIGDPVVSYREGKSNAYWAYTLDEGEHAGSLRPLYRPINPPGMPQIDLRGHREEEGEQQQ